MPIQVTSNSFRTSEELRRFISGSIIHLPDCCRERQWKELAEELIPISHNQFSIRKCQKILDAVKADGDTIRDYQSERDEITRGLVRDVKHYATQLEEVDKAISEFLPRFECTLNTIPGVNDITVAKLLSEIGDIRRFPNADKKELKFLAYFAGIAPVRFSSAGKGDDKPSKQGNRRSQGTIYFEGNLLPLRFR